MWPAPSVSILRLPGVRRTGLLDRVAAAGAFRPYAKKTPRAATQTAPMANSVAAIECVGGGRRCAKVSRDFRCERPLVRLARAMSR
jgi:hypothetical protein